MKLMVVDRNGLMMEGICQILARRNDVEDIAGFDNGDLATETYREVCPDLAIINFDSMGEEGFNIAECLHKYNGRVGIIGLFNHGKRDDIIRLMRTGGSACLLVNCKPAELNNAVDVVYEGGSLMNQLMMPVIAGLADNQFRSTENDNKSNLTSREDQVLEMIVEGKTTREIARQLNLSIYTVYTHKRNIKERLQVANDVQLVRKAMAR
ncbi:hypothetical protein AAU61_05075 [Desulfocarbo indianensis]|nr:hypothetical protein AAU61_05075 [Desulfocarbo indianensis]